MRAHRKTCVEYILEEVTFMRILIMVMVVLAVTTGIASSQTEVPLDRLPKVTGSWQAATDSTFRGKTKPSVFRLSTQGEVEFALNENYDWLLFELAMDDSHRSGYSAMFIVRVDGKDALDVRIVAPDAPRPFKIPVTGKARVLLVNYPNVISIINPRVVKGSSTAPSAGTGGDSSLQVPSAGGSSSGASLASSSTAASFAVDPNDLDKLAEGLRRAVDEDPAVRERLASGKIAIATFNLVDISSLSVAQNVAEDLATAMIEKKFRLVERGQLDKVLKELKVQNTGLIDPATALEIGRITGCSLILVGSISDRGGFVVVNARLLETATGDSVAAKRVEMRKIPILRQ